MADTTEQRDTSNAAFNEAVEKRIREGKAEGLSEQTARIILLGLLIGSVQSAMGGLPFVAVGNVPFIALTYGYQLLLVRAIYAEDEEAVQAIRAELSKPDFAEKEWVSRAKASSLAEVALVKEAKKGAADGDEQPLPH